MHGNRAVLTELLLRLVHLPQEVNEALATLRHALLRTVGELELADRSRRAVAGVCHLDHGNVKF